MSEQEQKKPQQRRPKKAGLGSALKKEKKNNMDYIVLPDNPSIKFYFKDIEDTRTNLRGGGICKKGMNKKARGANS
tara:strand:+ start:111 stop:338 length:228 start_codon:yes stop_codon:yes gene_type:complete